MKRFLAMLLAALMLLTALPAIAEGTYYDTMGLTFDFDPIKELSQNCPMLMEYGIYSHDPYTALVEVWYYDMPVETLISMQERMSETEEEEEAEEINQTLYDRLYNIGSIIVTNADTLGEAGIIDPLPEGVVATEFGALGDYHYYYIASSAESVMPAADDSNAADREKTKADIELLHSEILKLLQAAELSEPVDTEAGLVGQTIRFETTDLDGNPVSSADLFRDNEITMINLWGTWCENCMNEMGELAEIHKRIQEKGCGIVGVEYERQPIEEVADVARQVFETYGTTYPNVVIPEDDPILSQVSGYPTTFFVDSEGKILTYPIPGAAVDQYEATIDKLLAGEAIETVPETGATANDTGTYRVVVYDTEGNPIEGVVVQFCDDTTCSFEMTDAEGVATFNDREQKVWTVHLPVAPEGYAPAEGEYKTLDTFSDVNIFLEKAA